MASPFVWNVDPVLIQAGGLTVRYYGICFGLAITRNTKGGKHRVATKARAFIRDLMKR